MDSVFSLFYKIGEKAVIDLNPWAIQNYVAQTFCTLHLWLVKLKD